MIKINEVSEQLCTLGEAGQIGDGFATGYTLTLTMLQPEWSQRENAYASQPLPEHRASHVPWLFRDRLVGLCGAHSTGREPRVRWRLRGQFDR